MGVPIVTEWKVKLQKPVLLYVQHHRPLPSNVVVRGIPPPRAMWAL